MVSQTSSQDLSDSLKTLVFRSNQIPHRIAKKQDFQRPISFPVLEGIDGTLLNWEIGRGSNSWRILGLVIIPIIFPRLYLVANCLI